MAKNAVTDWDTTAANNTDVGGIGIQGSSSLANGDDALREIMEQIATFITAATFTGTTPVTLNWADNGATVGPTLTLLRTSTTPAVSDILGKVLFQGKDSAANTQNYAFIQAVIADPTSTSEDATLQLGVVRAGTEVGILQVSGGGLTLTHQSNITTINTDADTNLLVLQGSNTASTGGQVFAYGSTHASDAHDVAIYTNNTQRYRYDHSVPAHKFTGASATDTLVTVGAAHSTSGANPGMSLLTNTSTGRLATSTNTTGADSQQLYYNPNGLVGSISTSGSATAFNTSSDERLKQLFEAFDAGAIIDALSVYHFQWVKDGSWGYGVKAQEAHQTFPDAVTVGGDDPALEPWSVDYSKFVPLLIAEVKALRARVASLEAA